MALYFKTILGVFGILYTSFLKDSKWMIFLCMPMYYLKTSQLSLG
jgi:hypothetical protein